MSKRVPPADLDAVSAHLDRGWDLLKKNDLAGAEISAKKALAADPEASEAVTLLGAIAAAQGDDESALDQYRKAIEMDPEAVSAMLYAAETLLGSEEPEDAEEALRQIEDALEVAEEEEEFLDTLLLKAEALVALGRHDDAEAALEELPPVRFPEASYHVRAARTFLDLGMLEEAEKHYQITIEMEPKSSDAFHGLGCVAEEREDPHGMVTHWLKVRELDLADEEPPWSLSQEQFEKVAEDTIAELPEKIRKLLENVPIIASDYPSVEIVAEGNDPRILGFFSGVPYPEKANVMGGAPHLDCVFLYKRNIERMCRNTEETAKEIRTTVLHETGHFFGLDEDELEEMGLG